MRKAVLLTFVLLLCLPLLAAAENPDHTFGFTKQKCAAYADPARQTRLQDAEAYTFLAIDEERGGYLNTSAGWIEQGAVQTLRINYLEPRAVVFTSSTQMYATGNTNHPIGTRIPAGTAMTVRYGMEAQQSWYIVEYDGAWGFVPRGVTESMGVSAPETVTGRVLALVNEATPVYSYPNPASITKKHFPSESAVILENKTGAFYETALQGRRVYLNEGDVTVLLSQEAGSATEAWAGGLLDVYSVPSETWGRRIGEADVTGILPVAYRMGDWCSVSFGSVEGFVNQQNLSIAGDGSAQYSILISLESRVLCVVDANGQAVFGTSSEIGPEVVQGSYTLDSRADWEYVQPNFAPYCMAFSGGLSLCGPLCWGRNINTVRHDAAEAQMEGVVIPAAEAQWIFFHCPAGTALRVIP